MNVDTRTNICCPTWYAADCAASACTGMFLRECQCDSSSALVFNRCDR
jgi:hypothetical protein